MMSGRALASWVHVRDENGRWHTFGPGSDVPAWAEARITNPAAWTDTDQQQAQHTPPATEQPPPRHGKGSGRDAWAQYATRRGVAVTAADSRDDILDRLVAAEIPIE